MSERIAVSDRDTAELDREPATAVVPAGLAAESSTAEPLRAERGAPPGGPTPAAPVFLGLPYKWVALGVVILGTIMTILDATVVNVAIKTLQDAFHAPSYSDIAWVVTGYMLAQGAVIPMTGWATDRFGTKRLYLLTLVLFTVASAACGAAWSLPSLIFFRVLQGIGGGMMMPIGMTIILRAVGPREMGKVMGYFGVPMLLGPAIGPVLGGWFVQDYSWRLIFYINVPIGAVALFAAWRLLRETPTSSSFRLDFIGLLTATPAVVALMFGVDRSTEWGWGSGRVIGLLVVSAVLFAVFVYRQLRTEHPLLHLELFRDGTFSWSIVLGFAVVTAMFGAMFLIPVFLQQVHGYDPLQTGLILMPQALTAAVFMPIGGQLSDRIGPRPVVIGGLLLLVASSLLLAQLQPTTSIPMVIGALMLRGVAMAFAMMPGMSAGLARIPPALASRASSITNTAQRIGSSLGIAVLVTFLAAQTGTAAAQASCDPSPQVLQQAAAVQHLETVPTAARFCAGLRDHASGFAQTNTTAAPSTGHAEFDAFVKSYGDSAASIAFDRTFIFLGVVAALGLIPALFLRRPPARVAGGLALEA